MQEKKAITQWINDNKEASNVDFANKLFNDAKANIDFKFAEDAVENFVKELVGKQVAIEKLLGEYGQKIINEQDVATQIKLYEELRKQYVKIDDQVISSEEKSLKLNALHSIYAKHKSVLKNDKVKTLVNFIKKDGIGVDVIDMMLRQEENMDINTYTQYLSTLHGEISNDQHPKATDASMLIMKNLLPLENHYSDQKEKLEKEYSNQVEKLSKELNPSPDGENDEIKKSIEENISEPNELKGIIEQNINNIEKLKAATDNADRIDALKRILDEKAKVEQTLTNIQNTANLYRKKLLAIGADEDLPEYTKLTDLMLEIANVKTPVLKEIANSGRMMRLFKKHFLNSLKGKDGKMEEAAIEIANGSGNHNGMQTFLAMCTPEDIKYLAVIANEVLQDIPHLRTGFFARSGEIYNNVMNGLGDYIFFPILDFISLVCEYIGMGLKWVVCTPYDEIQKFRDENYTVNGGQGRDYNVYRDAGVEEFCKAFVKAMHEKVMMDNVGGQRPEQTPQEKLNDAIIELQYAYKYGDVAKAADAEAAINVFNNKLDNIKNAPAELQINELKQACNKNQNEDDKVVLKRVVEKATEILEQNPLMQNRIQNYLGRGWTDMVKFSQMSINADAGFKSQGGGQ